MHSRGTEDGAEVARGGGISSELDQQHQRDDRKHLRGGGAKKVYVHRSSIDVENRNTKECGEKNKQQDLGLGLHGIRGAKTPKT